MDYKKELEELNNYETTQWFKPQKGSYHIKILGEGDVEEKTFGDEKTTQWNIPVQVNEKNMMWSISKGKTLSSLYGQIIKICAAKEKATGIEFDLIVKSDGKKNDYTIPQAL